jgi:PAS domain S-box-containing protein
LLQAAETGSIDAPQGNAGAKALAQLRSGLGNGALPREAAPGSRRVFLSTMPAGEGQRHLALAVVLVSAAIFAAAAPFAKLPLGQVWAFLPAYQSALIVNELITALLLFGQFAILRNRALLVLACAYLFSAAMAVAHALSFPGLFAPGGLITGGPQTTAWIYFLWHAGFPLLVIAYALMRPDARERARQPTEDSVGGDILLSVAAVLGAAGLLVWLTTAGHGALPPIMQGNQDAPAKVVVATASWMLSLAALPLLWRRRPHSLLDLWLMVVMCVWVFDIALASVLNGARFDLGWYAGRAYGLLAASFVLGVLLLENSGLYGRLVEARELERQRAAAALARHDERLSILAKIDRAVVAETAPEEIAGAVIEPLRELLGVPRAIVNRFDLERGEVEWIAAAGRRRIHVGPGVRYSVRLMGDLERLRRGEPQRIDVGALPPGPDAEALLASGVRHYMVVPMLAGGELIGAVSFGGEADRYPAETVQIAQEVATQLAIAIAQARLLERVRRHAGELETTNLRLRESERRFSDLLGNVQLLSVMLDRKARITYCNEHLLRLTGWQYDEVIGRSWLELFIPPSSAGMAERLAVLFADVPEGRHGENTIVTRAGERRLVRWNNSVLRSAAGEVIGVASIGEDITDRRRAEQEIAELNASLERRVAERTAQLEGVNKELESFSYSVSHDLRAPLRAVDGYALMLEEDFAARLDDEGRRLLGVVRKEARRMGQLIDDLLEFSRMGRQPPAKRPVDMAALAREVVEELRGERPAAGIDALPGASADPAMLRQVWANLIGNAYKYSAKRGDARIEVGGRAEGAENLYWVRDNGAGFDMKYAAKLFGVFQRLHRADEFAGTGVGLAIVQRVVSRHGGRVWAEARPGEGACFYFTLPREA